MVVGLQEYANRFGRLLIMVDRHHHPEQLNMAREGVFFAQPHSFFDGSFLGAVSAGSLGPDKHRD